MRGGPEIGGRADLLGGECGENEDDSLDQEDDHDKEQHEMDVLEQVEQMLRVVVDLI